MADIERRHAELRLAAVDGGPGRVQGTILVYGATASDRRERFARNALEWDGAGVVLNLQHDRSQPLTRFHPTAGPEAVTMDVVLPDTRACRDACVLIRNGTLTGLSVEFLPVREQVEAGIRVIHQARLVGVGLVDQPSYAEAAVAVRHHRGMLPWL